MSNHALSDMDDMPVFWRSTLFCVSLVKAAVAGVGLALAVLGIFNLAIGLHWEASWGAVQAYVFSPILALGALAGVSLRIFVR